MRAYQPLRTDTGYEYISAFYFFRLLDWGTFLVDLGHSIGRLACAPTQYHFLQGRFLQCLFGRNHIFARIVLLWMVMEHFLNRIGENTKQLESLEYVRPATFVQFSERSWGLRCKKIGASAVHKTWLADHDDIELY